MREIKFRAWDKEKHEMLATFTTEDFFSSNGMLGNSHDDCVFMQYTGLKDIYGKDIWEGDIVDLPVLSKVIYEDGAFVLQAGAFSNGALIKDVLNLHPFAVIGNIYENPDLLK